MTDQTQPRCTCTGTNAGLNACTNCPTPWPDIEGAGRIRPRDEPAPPGRTAEEISAAVECAIGLNVDCGGTDGVHRVRDDVLAAIAEFLDIGEAEAWCKTCRRVWEGPRHRCESDAEQQLAALREVARDYCPACGRGDAAPTVDDWEAQRAKLTAVTALRDDLRDVTGARWIADALDNILDTPEPTP